MDVFPSEMVIYPSWEWFRPHNGWNFSAWRDLPRILSHRFHSKLLMVNWWDEIILNHHELSTIFMVNWWLNLHGRFHGNHHVPVRFKVLAGPGALFSPPVWSPGVRWLPATAPGSRCVDGKRLWWSLVGHGIGRLWRIRLYMVVTCL